MRPGFRRHLNKPARPLAILALAVLLAACGKGDDKKGAAAPAGGGMPPPEVGVVVATPGDIGLVTELPGRLEASRVAEVRARAAGILQRRLFKEGSDVKAGQPLFAIDAAPYQATYQSSQAQLIRAQANLTRTSDVAKRYAPLVAANAISKQDYDDAVAAKAQAEADVAVAKAAVQTAKISLDYAAVTAPISGRIGRALVTEGALVGQGEPTPLAVVQQINPLYVNFTQSASEALRLRRAMEAGTLKRGTDGAAAVRIVLEDGSEYAQAGRLLFTDLTVDQATGQITLRAEVPNPKGDLLPGLYVRVRVEQAQATNAISIPQQAVTRTDAGDTLTVVGADGKLAKRTVKIQAGQNNRWIVTEGLKAGEQVMVDGFQKLQMLPPGTPVKAVPWQAPGSAAPAASAAAPAASAAAPASAPKQ
ncbi:RND transporter [Pseudorhodoferax sp. Leaf267]|nr:RND transporter [Pseudorhodoferax sp. Leaf267]